MQKCVAGPGSQLTGLKYWWTWKNKMERLDLEKQANARCGATLDGNTVFGFQEDPKRGCFRFAMLQLHRLGAYSSGAAGCKFAVREKAGLVLLFCWLLLVMAGLVYESFQTLPLSSQTFCWVPPCVSLPFLSLYGGQQADLGSPP